ncbi:hypothetical protein IWW34DRAFT_795529 [Fusarium oxysporum f. sp. albedinis]|nr:hypothetical protein IWW34DRAFT_795529 [Fusarium oxysporum f. sp. albedinis]
MAALPDDVWRLIFKKLHLIDLFRFSSSHPNAKSVIGNSKTLWDSLFIKYGWVDDVRQRNQTPVLMFIDGENPYLYLYLAPRKGKKLRIDSDLKAEQNMALFTKIGESICSSHCGRTPFEVKFENYTLDISSALLPGNYCCPPLFQMSSNQKVVIAVYGEEFKDVKPELFKDYLGVIEL